MQPRVQLVVRTTNWTVKHWISEFCDIILQSLQIEAAVFLCGSHKKSQGRVWAFTTCQIIYNWTYGKNWTAIHGKHIYCMLHYQSRWFDWLRQCDNPKITRSCRATIRQPWEPRRIPYSERGYGYYEKVRFHNDKMGTDRISRACQSRRKTPL